MNDTTINFITIDARAIAMFVCGLVVGYFMWGL